MLPNSNITRNSSVNTGILNEKKLAPVHLATELNRVNALKIMGRFRSIIDIQKGGEHGRTALHLAAIHDHEECARILVGWVRIHSSNIICALVYCFNAIILLFILFYFLPRQLPA